jgi:hypothetical protein
MSLAVHRHRDRRALHCDERVMVENVHRTPRARSAGLARHQRQEIIIAAMQAARKPLFFALLEITSELSCRSSHWSRRRAGCSSRSRYTKTFTMAWAAFLSFTIGRH